MRRHIPRQKTGTSRHPYEGTGQGQTRQIGDWLYAISSGVVLHGGARCEAGEGPAESGGCEQSELFPD